MKTIENESGQFFVDDAGALVRFECDAKNNLKLPYSPGSRRLMHLHIPEGVQICPPMPFAGLASLLSSHFPTLWRRCEKVLSHGVLFHM